MKKNVFYFISIYLLTLFFSTNTQAQIADQPKFRSIKLPASGIEKSSSNVSTDLTFLYKKRLSEINNGNAETVPVTPHNGMQKYIQIAGNRVIVDITLKENNPVTRAELEKTGFKTFAAYGRMVSGSLPIEAISKLETITNIKFARPAYKPHLQFKPSEGLLNKCIQDTTILPMPVISQGDTAQRSYIARAKYKVNGDGVKVGILSDSYDNLETASIGVTQGELPGPANPFGFFKPVQVLEDNLHFLSADEGRGMAEIVHDVAPGAEIAFHTAYHGQADFAKGILDLADAGCKVIADDIFYTQEPYFQDGIIAQAVDKVKKLGVTYFSAAGNESRQSYESVFRSSNYSPFGFTHDTAHNFSAPGYDPVYFLPYNIPTFGSASLTLQWDDPFFSSGGKGAQSDLDFFLIDYQGYVVGYSNIDNVSNGDPVEFIDYTNNDPTSTLFYILIIKVGGPDPAHLKFIDYADGSFHSTAPAIPGLRAGTLVGHAKAAGAIATAAAFWLQTPAYGLNVPRVEPFSSMGGTPNYLDTVGNRTYVRLRKPEITAPDGGNTSFFPPPIYYGNQDISQDPDTYPNFFGTSAAAPHAAGIAALMIEAAKSQTLTPDQIKRALTATAIDMNSIYTPGFDSGFDYNTGYGLIQADKAIGMVKTGDDRPSDIIAAKPVVKLNAVHVYPNPATNNLKVYLSLNSLIKAEVSIYSIDGKMIYQNTSEANSVVDIDASKYRPGLYLLKVKQGGFNRTFKVIKQ